MLLQFAVFLQKQPCLVVCNYNGPVVQLFILCLYKLVFCDILHQLP